jgi:hypothetical protein
MKKKILFGATLILIILMITGLAVVPPCDQYLDWCMFTWCPQNNHNPADILACQTQCAVYWMENCN